MSFPSPMLYPSDELFPEAPPPGFTVPPLTDSAQRLYDAIAPLMNADGPGMADADNGFVGAILCGALAQLGLDQAAYVSRSGLNQDENGNVLPGFAVIFDVNEVEAQWLPWIAQFIGDSAAVQAASSVTIQRYLVQHPAQFQRGRAATIISKTKTTLTGTQTVLINQRTGLNPWTISVATLTAETGNPTATFEAIMSVMPAWLVPTISVVTGGDYATLAASHAEYTQMEADHTTYADIPTNPAA